ncbi:Putative peptidoglycan binding domain-containing protein [Desulfotomaculum arcticum]|uniref:Putative peptidoglycan binding domain-containing protein n=1 Tax=Desulfotruncus arcticus DSM 17038 TaxID=1121424 RepID=A0A1I2N5X9_9FIRM|nr:peptidoglycan-binding protein [Desulfotruncus arcticus]SFF99315.1 Putative peptidoglycan binding domain-containing protein [Desulfotomaculum arcticum] [Desulfotruncus arcticus DSM 17038]
MQKSKNTCIIIVISFFCVIFFLTEPAEAVPECEFCRNIQGHNRVFKIQQPSMCGPDIELLQRMLRELDYYHGPINGVYEKATALAVNNFQEARGIIPDGIFTEKTRQALDDAYCLSMAKSDVPPPPGEVSILIDTRQRKLTIMADGEPYKQYAVAVGKHDTPTPIGNFKVLRKAMNWGTGFGTRWIGLTAPWGIYGIHGTNKPYSIGSYASHGCIRMNNVNVEEIYPWIKPDTRVVILGNPLHYQPSRYRTMRRDERGGDVLEVQIRLKRLGFYNGPIDGIWGGGMEKAVIEFRKAQGLPFDNSVDSKVYAELGL